MSGPRLSLTVNGIDTLDDVVTWATIAADVLLIPDESTVEVTGHLNGLTVTCDLADVPPNPDRLLEDSDD